MELVRYQQEGLVPDTETTVSMFNVEYAHSFVEFILFPFYSYFWYIQAIYFAHIHQMVATLPMVHLYDNPSTSEITGLDMYIIDNPKPPKYNKT